MGILRLFHFLDIQITQTGKVFLYLSLDSDSLDNLDQLTSTEESEFN